MDGFVIQTSWVLDQRTEYGEWKDVPDYQAKYRASHPKGRVEILVGFDAMSEEGDFHIIKLFDVLDSISANGGSIKPIPNYVADEDSLNPHGDLEHSFVWK